MQRITTLALAILIPMLAAFTHQNGEPLASLKGDVKLDGSSTVYPITEAVAEEFCKVATKVRVTVGVSGTGGGFKRFCKGETDITNASRPITRSELEAATSRTVEFIELPIAYDGLCVVIHPKNTWAGTMTMDQLKQIYSATGTAKTWKDVDPSWPDRPIKVYSPGTDSGTFDFFRDVTVGKDGKIRADISVSEDDNVLVHGISQDQDAIGYFGFAYYQENRDKLKSVAIDSGKGAVLPSDSTILDGTYSPMSRPLFLYVNRANAAHPHIAAFVDFFLQNATTLSKEVGYTPLPESIGGTVMANWKARRTGTQFLNAAGEKVSGTLAAVYR